MFVVKDAEFTTAGVEGELKLRFLKLVAVLISKNRDQHLALQLIFYRIPIDIEKVSVLGGLAIFEYIQPPCIVAAHHSHVVRDNVQNLSHAVAMKLGDEMLVIFG